MRYTPVNPYHCLITLNGEKLLALGTKAMRYLHLGFSFSPPLVKLRVIMEMIFGDKVMSPKTKVRGVTD